MIIACQGPPQLPCHTASWVWAPPLLSPPQTIDSPSAGCPLLALTFSGPAPGSDETPPHCSQAPPAPFCRPSHSRHDPYPGPEGLTWQGTEASSCSLLPPSYRVRPPGCSQRAFLVLLLSLRLELERSDPSSAFPPTFLPLQSCKPCWGLQQSSSSLCSMPCCCGGPRSHCGGREDACPIGH